MGRESSTGAGAPAAAGAAVAAAAGAAICQGEGAGPGPGGHAFSPSRTYRRWTPPRTGILLKQRPRTQHPQAQTYCSRAHWSPESW